MGKLRGKTQNNKINMKSDEKKECFSAQYPWFSFQNMTKNSKYNLSELHSGKEKEETLEGLYRRLQELSEYQWIYWMQQPKQSGLETLCYGDIKFEASRTVKISKDTSVYVFRFDTHKGRKTGRIIGYKNSPCSVLYIIGYDLDFSAYAHG